MQTWLDGNDILMCSSHNEGKSIVAESFKKILMLITLTIVILTKNLLIMVILLRLKKLNRFLKLLSTRTILTKITQKTDQDKHLSLTLW